jgi:hypothetical protein
MCVVRLEEVRATLTRGAPAARRPRILEVRRATEARTETKTETRSKYVLVNASSNDSFHFYYSSLFVLGFLTERSYSFELFSLTNVLISSMAIGALNKIWQ